MKNKIAKNPLDYFPVLQTNPTNLLDNNQVWIWTNKRWPLSSSTAWRKISPVCWFGWTSWSLVAWVSPTWTTRQIFFSGSSQLCQSNRGFLIAPQLTSERRSSLRDEWRSSGAWVTEKGIGQLWGWPVMGKLEGTYNILKHSRKPVNSSVQPWPCKQQSPNSLLVNTKDKLDARMLLLASPINIRCDVPPSSKKVANTFPGWAVFQNGTMDSNVWSKSMMMQDRCPGLYVACFSGYTTGQWFTHC